MFQLYSRWLSALIVQSFLKEPAIVLELYTQDRTLLLYQSATPRDTMDTTVQLVNKSVQRRGSKLNNKPTLWLRSKSYARLERRVSGRQ